PALPTPPPTPTLFPYTPLFRSSSARQGGHTGPPLHGQHNREHCSLSHIALHDDLPAVLVHDALSHGQADAGAASLGAVIGLENLDRKSTRLNSSHVAISYAVFC